MTNNSAEQQLTGIIATVDQGDLSVGAAVIDILANYDLVEKGAVPCVEVRLAAPYNGEPDVHVNVSGWAVDGTGQLDVLNREGKSIARYRAHVWLTVIDTVETDSEATR